MEEKTEAEDGRTIEQRVADAILERKQPAFEAGGRVWTIGDPSIATLIEASEVIARLPIMPKDTPNDKILYTVLAGAKGFRQLGDLAAVLILGAGHYEEEEEVEVTRNRLFGLWKTRQKVKVTRDRRRELAKIIMENVRPRVLFNAIIRRLNDMEIGDFFAITTSLSEANLLRAAKEE